jgi:hypothetical protein
MIKKIYDMTLKLITPSEKGNRLDFTTKQDDILEAVCFFNEKFRTWSKRIIVYMISKNSIHLLLLMEKEKDKGHITAREIRYFTTYLNNIKLWNEYSRNESKLFESVNFYSCGLDIAKRQIDGIDEESGIYRVQLEDIDFFRKEALKSGGAETGPQHAEGDNDIADDDIVAIVSYLIKTKEKGDNSKRKIETLSSIKNILKEWI